MKKYSTQKEAARLGIITEEMRAVAKKEFRTEEEILKFVKDGQVVICAVRSMNKALAGEYIDIL